MQGWLAAAAAAATTAASAMQERAASAASAVQERLEDEKEGFLAEFQRCSAAAATAAHPAAGAPVGEALSLSGGAAASSGSGALGRFKRVGMTLLNPLADQDSVSANARAIHSSGVVMLPWEQPGLSPDVRARMRRASQDRTIFLAPPACLVDLNPPFVFSLEASVHIVLEALSVDKRLEAQRHALVPKEVSEELFFFHYFAHLHALSTGASPAVDTPPGGLSLASAEVRSDAESSAVVVSNSSGSEATEVGVPGSPSNTSPARSPSSPIAQSSAAADAEFDAIALELDAISNDAEVCDGRQSGEILGDRAVAGSGGAVGGASPEAGATGDRDACGPALTGTSAVEEDAEAEWEAELRAELEGLQ